MAHVLGSAAYALPQGGTVIEGDATIEYGTDSVVISQGSANVIIEWDSFDVAVDESVHFDQSALMAALNRVLSGEASVILGSISGAGSITLVNTAGIAFGATANVDVGAITATTIDILNANFMANTLTFDQYDSDFADATVTNDGTITVSDQGLAALVAPGVANNGLIQARTGAVVLASGTAYTVDFYGDGLINFAVTGATEAAPVDAEGNPLDALVSNSGEIYADGGTVILAAEAVGGIVDNAINMNGVIQARSITGHGGQIALVAGEGAGAVQVAGTLDASGAEAGTSGGTVHALGDEVALNAGADVNVSGQAGGGEVLVGGAFQGGDQAGAALQYTRSDAGTTIIADAGPGAGNYYPSADITYVAAGASVSADALDDGEGGTVIVWSTTSTRFHGVVSARGGAKGGDGGFVEVSGSELVFAGGVDTTAAAGATGWLLLDPAELDVTTDPSAVGEPQKVNDGDLNAALATSNVGLQANGRITVEAGTAVDTGANTLFFDAPTVDLGADIIGTVAGASGFAGSYPFGGTPAGLDPVTVNVLSDLASIQDAVDIVGAGGTVNVGDGLYVENVLIDKNLALLSVNGRALATIEGISGVGALGAVQVTSNTTGVEIGRAGQGFTIVGIDNGAPGIENAAVYFQGNHADASIVDNEIVANGDSGLTTEYGATISGFVIDGNEFSGQTFVGAMPAGEGFGSQFTLPNVPRQLVVMGGGSGGGNTSDVTFTNNVVSGTAGGISSDAGNPEQGNTLVTIDSVGATITGNSFAGVTTWFGASLRARGSDTVISGNTFDGTGQGLGTSHLAISATTFDGVGGGDPANLNDVVAQNAFVGNGAYAEDGSGIFLSIAGAIADAPVADTVHVFAGTYVEQLDIGKDLSLVGAGIGATIVQSPAVLATSFTTSNPNKAIVYAHDAAVDITGLTVDGLGLGNGNYRFTGIAYHNADGTIDGVAVTNIVDTPFSGVQGGTGIFGWVDDGGPHSVTVQNSTITNFQKNGITMSGEGLTAEIMGNTVTGAGPTTVTAQNGIQLSFGAGGTVGGNIISGIGYTPSSWSASSILIYDAAAGVVIDGNDVTGTGVDLGIAVISTENAIVSDNAVDGSGFGIYVDSYAVYAFPADGADGAQITGNQVVDAEVGIGVYDVANALIGANAVTGGDYGLDLQALGQIDVTGNVLADQVVSAITVYDGGAFFDIHDNSIVAALGGVGLDNQDTEVVDASGNWWGSADEDDVADQAVGLVDFTPFLTSAADTDVVTAGFQGDFSELFVTALGEQSGAGGRVQEGVDLVTASTVIVGAGSYVETVLIDMGLELVAANNEGIAPDGVRGAESEIVGGIRVDANVSGVTIDGLKISDGAAILGETAGVYINNDASAVTIQNVIFERTGGFGGARGIITSTSGVSDVDILDNLFTGWATGVFVNPNADDVVVQGNLFDGNNVGMSNDGPTAGTGVTIADNVFTNSAFEALGLGGAGTRVITGNDFSDNAVHIGAYAGAVVPDIATLMGNGNTFDRWVTISAGSGGRGAGSVYGLIQPAIDDVAAGGTVLAGPFSFAEALVIQKGLTLSGSTDIGGAPATTVAPAAGIAITIEGPGFAPADTVTVENLALQGAGAATGYGMWVDNTAVFATLTVQNATFDGFGNVGFYEEADPLTGQGIDHTVLTGLSFTNNGSNGGGGTGDISFWEFNEDATLTDITLVGSATGPSAGARSGIQFRGIGDGDGVREIASGTVVLDNVDVSGDYRTQMLGIQRYKDVSAFSFTDVALGGPTSGIIGSFGAALRFDGVGDNTASSTIDLGNTAFLGLGSAGSLPIDIEFAPDNTFAYLVADATQATFGAAGTIDTVAEGLAQSDRVLDAIDWHPVHGPVYGTFKGVAILQADTLFVTQASETSIVGMAGAIQRGVDAASAGWTVHVGPGTFGGPVVVDKALTIIGDGTTATTTVTGSGTGTGITVAADSVSLTGMIVENFTYGIEVASGSVADLAMDDILARTNDSGFKVASVASVDGLTVTDSHFDDNTFGWYLAKDNSTFGDATADAANVTDVTVTGTSFDGNLRKGIYAEKLDDASFTAVTVIGSGVDLGYAFNSGIDINLKNGTYADIAFDDLTVTGSGLNGTGRGTAVSIKARNDGASYGPFPASLTNVTIAGSTITAGGDIALAFGNGIDGAGLSASTVAGPEAVLAYAGVINVSVTGNDITSAGVSATGPAEYGVALDGVTGADIENNDIVGGDANVLVSGTTTGVTVFDNSLTGAPFGVANAAVATVDASGNWWGTTVEATVLAMTSGAVDITPFLFTGVNNAAGLGFAGDFSDLFVTSLGGQVQAGGRINEAIGLLADGAVTGVARVIYVGQGTYAENVMIDKAMNLRGWQADFDARTRVGPEAIVEGYMRTEAGIDGLIINGFSIVNQGDAVPGFGGIVSIALNNNVNDVQVINTRLDGDGIAGARGVVTSTAGVSNVTVAQNTFTGFATGVYVNPNADNVLVQDNDFDGNFVGMSHDGPTVGTGVIIDGNSFANSGFEALGLGGAGTRTITDNDFADNGVHIGLYAGATIPPIATLEADGNTFDRWVTISAGLPGGREGGSVYGRIQPAIDDVAVGGTVTMGAFTFENPAQVLIDKSITVTGQGVGATIVTPGFDTGASGDSRGWWLVEAGAEVHLSEFTMDGSGHLVYQAIRHKGSGTIDNLAFTEIKYNESGPHYNGVAVAAFGDGAVHISNSTFSEIGRIGVLYFGSGVAGSVFSGNTYTGKGVGDWLDYALDISNGAEVTATGNTITGNRGVASSDGSTSAGILVSTFFGPGTSALIENNFINDNTTGVFVGFDGADTSAATVFGNDLSGNDTGVRSTAATVDASANWWGLTDEADVLAYTSGPVDITPFLTSGADTDVAVGFQGDFSELFVTSLGEQVGAVGRVQEGVDLVTASRVIVGAGSYVETVLIDMGLELVADNNEGIDPNVGPRGTESEIVGGIRVDANVSGVTIDGLKITDGAAILGETAGVYVNNNASDVTIQNVIFERTGGFGGARGVITSIAGASDVDILNNLFTGWATGVFVNPNADGVLVQGNTFDGNNVGMSNDGPTGAGGVTIDDNVFTNSAFEALGLGGAGTRVITGNAFSDNPVHIGAYGTAVVPDIATLLADGNTFDRWVTISAGLAGGRQAGSVYGQIQPAVDDVAIGGTVTAGPGTFVENVAVGKALTLLSDQGRDFTTIEGISFAGALGTIVLLPGVDDVTIGGAGQGFTIEGIDNGAPGVENAAVYLQGAHANIDILGNEIVAMGDHGLLSEYGAVVDDVLIDGNIFSGQSFLGANPAGIGFGSQFTLANVPRQLVVMGGGTGGGSTSNVTFTNNEVTGTAGGISSDDFTSEQGNTLVTIDSVGATISGNLFSGTTTRFATQLRARGPNTEISGNTFLVPTAALTGGVFVTGPGSTVTANTFTGGSNGLIISAAGSVAVENNVFDGQTGTAIAVQAGGGFVTVFDNSIVAGAGGLGLVNTSGDTVDASANWWGTAVEADVLARTIGPVDITPFLVSGTDTDAAAGFQGDFTTLFATTLGEQVGATGRIQEAIDLVTASTVILGVGTFVDPAQVVIDKDITIYGQGTGTTTVMLDFDTTSSGNGRGWWLVEPGYEVHLSDFTMDGSGHKVWQAIRHQGFGTIDSLELTEIKFDESGPSYSGLGVAAFGNGAVDITNSTFSEIGRVGVLYFGTGVSGSAFSGNIYTGKGDGDFLDYGIEVGGGASSILIQNNQISDNRGVASSDGSTSAGILVTTYFGPGSSAIVEGNTLTDNATGLYVGYGNDGGQVEIGAGNVITGGARGIVFTGDEQALAGNTFSNTAFSGQGEYYIALFNDALSDPLTVTVLDASAVTFDGVTGGAATPAQLVAIEDKLLHHLDDADKDLIFIQGLVVTPGNSIQLAVNAAGLLTGPQTVTVGAGTYGGSVEIWVDGLTVVTMDGAVIDTDAVDAFANNNDVGNGFYVADQGDIGDGGALALLSDSHTVNGRVVDGVSIGGFSFVGSGLGVEIGGTMALGAADAARNTLVDGNSFAGVANGIVGFSLGGNTTLSDNVIDATDNGILSKSTLGGGATVDVVDNDIEAGDHGVIFKGAINGDADVFVGGNLIYANTNHDSTGAGVWFDKEISHATVRIGDGNLVSHASNVIKVGDPNWGYSIHELDGIHFAGKVSWGAVIRIDGNRIGFYGSSVDGPLSPRYIPDDGIEFQEDVKGDAYVAITDNQIKADSDGILFEDDVRDYARIQIGGWNDWGTDGNIIAAGDEGIVFEGWVQDHAEVVIQDNWIGFWWNGWDLVKHPVGGNGIEFSEKIKDHVRIEIVYNSIRSNREGIAIDYKTRGRHFNFGWGWGWGGGWDDPDVFIKWNDIKDWLGRRGNGRGGWGW